MYTAYYVTKRNHQKSMTIIIWGKEKIKLSRVFLFQWDRIGNSSLCLNISLPLSLTVVRSAITNNLSQNLIPLTCYRSEHWSIFYQLISLYLIEKLISKDYRKYFQSPGNTKVMINRMLISSNLWQSH